MGFDANRCYDLASKQPSSSTQSRSNSGTDSDDYGARRRNVPVKKQRGHLQVASDSTPSHAELRFSTRKAAKVSNYNEDDDDNMFEDDTEMLTPNYWAAEQDENIQAIDVVLNHKPRDGIGMSCE